MKKRNRLLSSPNQNRIFTSARAANSPKRHLLLISFLAIIGIFITSMVLARSEPTAANETKSLVLPQTSSIETELPLPLVPPSEEESTDEVQLTEQTPVEAAALAPEITPQETQRLVAAEVIETEIEWEEVPTEIFVSETTSDNETPISWQVVEVKSGDNLSLIFPRVGLGASDVYRIAQTPDTKPLLNLRPGQSIKFGLIESTENERPRLEVLQLQLSPLKTLEVTATENGYVANTSERETQQQQQIVAGEIQNSLFLDGQKAGMSDRLIMEMARIFGWDIDFALDLRQGDSFKVIFDENYLDGEKINDGDILAAEFVNRGKVFRAVRFTDEEGKSDFYTPDGNSMRKAFTRTPVSISRISSRFNPNRLHPILKTNRPHRGVDYAAPTGTPILATGDGTINFIGTKGGYGRTVIVSHAGRYTTLFAHMSNYKKGLKTGQRVRQGDVIGYVGMTGTATGPHLHYEFRVDGVHKDPLTVALPNAEGIPSKYRSQFSELSKSRLASLESVQIPSLAALASE